MKESHDFFEMKLPAKPEYVGVIRLTISGIANRMGFSYEDIEDIKIALSEAVTNTIHFAYPKENGEITVGFGIYPSRLEMVVTDNEKNFNAHEILIKEGSGNANKNAEKNGVGLFLIESLMDRLQINTEAGVILTMTKFLRRDGVHDRDSTISASEPR